MKRLAITFVLGLSALAIVSAQRAHTSVQPGSAAPSFSLGAADGKSYNLAEYKGKYVVLEWTNKDCPYVKKHYGSGNMQKVQKEATAMGAVWLSVISAGPGYPGYLNSTQADEYYKNVHSEATAVLLDPGGKVAKEYGASNTPQIVIVDPAGKVVYNGAIDDKPTPDPDSVKSATNYVIQALKESMAGKSVSISKTRPYGCGIHYGG